MRHSGRGRVLLTGVLVGSVLSAGFFGVAPTAVTGAPLPTVAVASTHDDDDKLSTTAVDGDSEIAEKAAKDVAKESEGFLEHLGWGLFDSALDMGFEAGVTELISLMFPNKDDPTDDKLTSILSALAAEQESINELSDQMVQLSAQVSTDTVLSAGSLCSTATVAADNHVDTIKLALDNLKPVFDAQWLYNNLPPTGGADGFNTIGNQVFGKSGSTSPSFLSGLNGVAIATQNLGNSLSSSAGGTDGGIVAKCADAIAAKVAAQLKAQPAGTPSVIGVADTAYFQRLQRLTAYYTSWVNVGAGLSVLGGYMATAVNSSNPPTNVQQAKLLCANAAVAASWNATSCGGVASILPSSRKAIAAAWDLTGASWSQATGGVLGAALGVPGVASTAAGKTFTNSDTIWLKDIANYGSALGGTYQVGNLSIDSPSGAVTSPKALPDSTSPESTLASQKPISQGVAAAYDLWRPDKLKYSDNHSMGWIQPWRQASLTFKNPGWMGAKFTAASTAQWDGLLNLNQAPLYAGATPAQAGQSRYCLSYNDLRDEAYNCTSPRIGSLMTQAGLLNGGKAPSNLIIYTGETRQFLPEQSPMWWSPRANAGNTGRLFPKDWAWPPQTVASFLDTESAMVNGFSAVMNPPTGASEGISTPSSIAPFISQKWDGSVMTSTMSSVVGSKAYTAVACGKDSTGDVSKGSSPYSLGQFFNGDYKLECNGAISLTPNNGAQAIAHTPNASFYASLSSINRQDMNTDWYFCDWPANANCPANPFWNKNGTYPGWLLDGGFYPTSGPTESANTQAVAPTPQTQYMWPVLNVGATCSNTISFTSGVSGTVNVPKMCKELFRDYISSAYGVQFGNVSVEVDAGMKNGDNSQLFAGIVLRNASGQSQTGKLLIQPSSNLTIVSDNLSSATALSSGNGSTTNPLSNCKQVAGSNWLCTVNVYPGQTGIKIPVSTQTGKSATLQVTYTDGPDVVATTTRTVYPGKASSVAVVPDQLVGVKFTAGSAGMQPTLSWMTPLQAYIGGIDGYKITAYQILSDGTKSKAYSNNVAIDDPGLVTSGAGVGSSGLGRVSSYSLSASSLPSAASLAGKWSISIQAYNGAGAGPLTTVTGSYTNGAPDQVSDFTALQQPDGSVLLDWSAVDAAPSVAWYKLSATSPGSAVTIKRTVSHAGELTQSGLDAGLWNFSLVASNSVGDSKPATASVQILGSIPAEPSDVDVTVNMFGQVGLTWKAPSGNVLPPHEYEVSVYTPSASGSMTPNSTPAMTKNVPVSPMQSTISIPVAAQLGKNALPGAYVVSVQAVNDVGAGPARFATVLVTSALVEMLTREASIFESVSTGSKKLLQDVESYACKWGSTKIKRYVTGTCADGVWTSFPGYLVTKPTPKPTPTPTPSATPTPTPTVTGQRTVRTIGCESAYACPSVNGTVNPDGSLVVTMTQQSVSYQGSACSFSWNVRDRSTDRFLTSVSPMLAAGETYTWTFTPPAGTTQFRLGAMGISSECLAIPGSQINVTNFEVR